MPVIVPYFWWFPASPSRFSVQSQHSELGLLSSELLFMGSFLSYPFFPFWQGSHSPTHTQLKRNPPTSFSAPNPGLAQENWLEVSFTWYSEQWIPFSSSSFSSLCSLYIASIAFSLMQLDHNSDRQKTQSLRSTCMLCRKKGNTWGTFISATLTAAVKSREDEKCHFIQWKSWSRILLT